MQIQWYTDSDELVADRYIQIEEESGQPTRRKVTLEFIPDDSSYRYRALMDLPQLNLKFSLPCFVEIPVGAWCDFQGQRFYLNAPENIKKQGTRYIEYSIKMGTAQDNLALYKMRNTVDHRLKWSMCAKPHEFVEEIVRNLNLRDSGAATLTGVWRIDREGCIQANEKTVEFNHTSILDALKSVAEKFETEWEIVEDADNGTFTIVLHKVERMKDNPLSLSYGKGKGFVPGVGRTNSDNDMPIKRLYVQGTDRNIDRSKNNARLYGATGEAPELDATTPELRLPSSQKILYDGSHYAYINRRGILDIIVREDGFVDAQARCYITDPDGFFVERYYRGREKPTQSTKEDSLDCSEIYPSFYSKPTSVVAANKDKNFYDIYDITITDDLNFEDYRIAGEKITMIFQSGMLAGKEFEVNLYKHDELVNGVRRPVRRFELVPQEIDGVMMPNETFKPTTNDEYAIFGIMLPQSYICNNTTHKGAAWDMFREAVRHLYENEYQKFTFTGELQGLWAKRNWLQINGYMHVGSYINFSDEQFAPEGELIRITGIKDFVNMPYSPTIELANSVSTSRSLGSKLRDIDNTEVVISDVKKDMIQYTKRRYRDAKETLEAMADVMSDNFTAGINPVAIQTMATLIGDESLQFRFITINGDTYTEAELPYDYSQTNGLHISPCYLQHLTLNQSLTAEHDHSRGNYDIWEMGELSSSYLDPSVGRLYLYAVCPKAATQGQAYRRGQFQLFDEKQDFYDGENYNMLVGLLSSEYEGERSFVTVYGFTELLPGRITTDRIVSADGESAINLSDGSMKLGDCLVYNKGGDKTLRLKFLTAEGSNLGGWVFRDDKLISQRGTVNGEYAEYGDVEAGGQYPGDVFIPNISMDAIDGKIMANNIVIDSAGITLYNAQGEAAAVITNDTIGNIGALADSDNNRTDRMQHTEEGGFELPYGVNPFRRAVQIGELDMGYLSAQSIVTYNSARLEFEVPRAKNDPEPNDIRCPFAWLHVDLYRGNHCVAELASCTLSPTPVHGGSPFVMTNDTSKTVTVGRDVPAGQYRLRIWVEVDYVGDHAATIDATQYTAELNYTYRKAGFKRTILGNNGFYTSWAQNQYIYASSEGITLRHGDAVIKLSAAGLQKSTSGMDNLTNL